MSRTRRSSLLSKWAATWQNQNYECVPSEDSDQPGHPPRLIRVDQPGHPPSLIRVFAVRMKKAWVLSYPLSAQQRPWSDWANAQADLSLPWAHTIRFVGFVNRRLVCGLNCWCACSGDILTFSWGHQNTGRFAHTRLWKLQTKTHIYRNWAKDWTATCPQDQLRFGLISPPSSFAGLYYYLFAYAKKFSWFEGSIKHLHTQGPATTEFNWSSYKTTASMVLMNGCACTFEESLIDVLILWRVILSLHSWEDVVTHHFSLDLRKKNIHVVLPDELAVERLRSVPKTWTIEHDESLVRLMSKHVSPDNEQLGSIKNYVESIDVSSFVVSDYHKNPKISDTQKFCWNDPKICTRWLYHYSNSSNRCRRNGIQCSPWSGAVRFGSTLFAWTCLSENLGSLWYFHILWIWLNMSLILANC